ncbi:MAG: helix-hairpin-helix domain-containing protein [Flavobacteriaceae bacterium]|nr:helix-hairpin-helix domain-containing protein [Flavobacteriaceae bacterium]
MKLNLSQRSGLVFLLVILGSVQAFIWFKNDAHEVKDVALSKDLQLIQWQIDSLKAASPKRDTIYPFNPNYLTDYKGYQLGMSLEEIDRLMAFRKTGKFVNSVTDFQQVTAVSDSLLDAISPYFKFPDWVVAAQKKTDKDRFSNTYETKANLNAEVSKVDLNTATAEDLKTIYGIGEKLSVRIVEFREKLGGFAADFQLYDVYGLDTATVEKALKKFTVLTPVAIEKLDVNTATYDQLKQIPYLNSWLARKIITFRQNHGPIEDLQELTKIQDFPTNRLSSIALYLYTKKL